MLSFHGSDRCLLEYELTSTGITYCDTSDILIIAPDLRGNMPREWSVGVETTASDVVQLMHRGEAYVGVACCPVRNLVYWYWNSWRPGTSVPACYFADLMDLYLADPEMPPLLRYGDQFDEALDAHRRAREILRQSEDIPAEIMERIWRSIGNQRETRH